MKSEQKADFIRNIRDRVKRDQMLKRKVEDKHRKDLEKKKREASLLRE
jgi:hypothetical protein